MKKVLSAIIYIFILLLGIILVGFGLKFDNSTTEIVLNDEQYANTCNFSWYGFKLVGNIPVDTNLDRTNIGEYIEKCNYKKIVNFKTERTIMVKEFESPVITLEGNGYACPNGEYVEEGFTAIDNYDGDITDKVEVIKEQEKYTYIVSDKSKNKTIVERNIIYQDSSAPTIKLVDGNLKIYKGNAYKEPGYRATDDCLGDITDKVVISNKVDTSKVGTYEITYTVSDGYNTTTVKRSVSVVNKTTTSSTGKKGVIYLTFDDGPSPSTTTYILDILKKYNVKATFFVVPKNSNNYYLIKREYNEGHTVAIHSNSHTYSQIYASDTALFNDINAVNDKLKSITGEYSYIYRYPGGSSNTVSKRYSKGIITRTSAKLHELGFHYFDWNISSGDASSPVPSTDQIYRNVVNNLSKNRANVVLMHDVKYNTSRAVEKIIKYGLEHGYTFERITMDTKEVHHGIAN